MARHRGIARRVLVLGATGATGWLLVWSARPRVVELAHGWQGSFHPGATTLDVLVVDLATSAAAAIWLVLVVSASWTLMVEMLSSRRPSSRFSRLAGPASWRRLVLGALGISFVAPTLTGAWAAEEQSHRHCAVVCKIELDGLPLPQLQPDARAGTAQRAPLDQALRQRTTRLIKIRAPAARCRVTVQPGDSLWVIAVRQLADGASAAEVAHFSARLYDVNRAVIGPDPDLIFAGTSLISPGGTAHAH